jgi:hypothetical protein
MHPHMSFDIRKSWRHSVLKIEGFNICIPVTWIESTMIFAFLFIYLRTTAIFYRLLFTFIALFCFILNDKDLGYVKQGLNNIKIM